MSELSEFEQLQDCIRQLMMAVIPLRNEVPDDVWQAQDFDQKLDALHAKYGHLLKKD